MNRKALLLLMALLTVSFAVGCTSPANMEKALESFFEKNPQFLEKKIQEAMKKNPGAAPRAPELPLEERIKNAIQVDLNNAPTLGPDTAAVTIVEFSDFQCPFCARVAPTMEQLVKEYNGKVRVAFRQHPLSFHKNAMSAAKAALAAHKQGKFWQMHDALFAGQKDLSDEGIKKIAKDLKLNMAKFEKDWKSTEFDKQIQADLDFSNKQGATGTPAFFVNGVYVKGAKPVEAFREIIDKVLEAKGGPAAQPPTVAPATQPTGNPS